MPASSTRGADPSAFPELELRTRDGLRLAARRRPPASADHPMVVIAHGFTGHQDHPSVLAVAAAIASTGAGVVTFDARGHGRSDGHCTLGASEPSDVAAATDLAREHADHVVVIGTSMGAIAALRYAATDQALDGLVLVSCPATWRLHSLASAAAAVATRTWPGRRFMARTQRVRIAGRCRAGEPPVVTAARVACPTAVIHGADDRFIPPIEGTRLHDALAGPRTLELVKGMGHAFESAAHAAILRALTWVGASAPTAAPGRA